MYNTFQGQSTGLLLKGSDSRLPKAPVGMQEMNRLYHQWQSLRKSLTRTLNTALSCHKEGLQHLPKLAEYAEALPGEIRKSLNVSEQVYSNLSGLDFDIRGLAAVLYVPAHLFASTLKVDLAKNGRIQELVQLQAFRDKNYRDFVRKSKALHRELRKAPK